MLSVNNNNEVLWYQLQVEMIQEQFFSKLVGGFINKKKITGSVRLWYNSEIQEMYAELE